MSQAIGELRFDGNFQPSDVLHHSGHHWRVHEVLGRWKPPTGELGPGVQQCFRLAVWGPLPGEPERRSEFTMKAWTLGDQAGWRISPGPAECMCPRRAQSHEDSTGAEAVQLHD
ncbi:MAG TPA: hypothetical protein VIV12_25610 [Streptosporangiaceae bacterium]